LIRPPGLCNTRVRRPLLSVIKNTIDALPVPSRQMEFYAERDLVEPLGFQPESFTRFSILVSII
jgi:hypothetical protein